MNFPALPLSSARFWLWGNTALATSPSLRIQQAVSLGGSVWRASATLDKLTKPERRDLDVFLAGQDGAFGTFLVSPYQLGNKRDGTGTGTVLVKGAGQTGVSLTMDGWGAGALAFRKGDYLSFVADNRLELHIVTADVTASPDGEAVVPIRPPIRTPPNDNAAVEYLTPVCLMRIISDDHGGVEVTAPFLGSMTLEMIESRGGGA